MRWNPVTLKIAEIIIGWLQVEAGVGQDPFAIGAGGLTMLVLNEIRKWP